MGDQCTVHRVGATSQWRLTVCSHLLLGPFLLAPGCSSHVNPGPEHDRGVVGSKVEGADGGVDGAPSQADWCVVEGRDYSGDAQQCATLMLSCEDGAYPFSDACGCGCFTLPESCKVPGRHYVTVGRNSCAGATIHCDPGDLYFADDCGCGCEVGRDDEGEGLSERSVPDGFEEVESPCPFHFYAPSDIEEVPVQGIDSCVAQYMLNDCEILADYGAFSDRLDDYDGQSDYERDEPIVDHRPGRLISYHSKDGSYAIGLNLPVSEEDSRSTSLTLFATCSSETSRDELRAVFLTVVLE